jgi:hypothetical protein
MCSFLLVAKIAHTVYNCVGCIALQLVFPDSSSEIFDQPATFLE